MKAVHFAEYLKKLNIETIAGVPDSTLKEFCGYLNTGRHGFKHFTLPNEGSAVGLAAGVYLSTGYPACVYMQNSGLGNAVNPITSIVNKEVYDIPVLFVIGYRGDFTGIPDEPQHRFMGKITEKLLDCLEIEYTVLDSSTDIPEIDRAFESAHNALRNNKQYTIAVRSGFFSKEKYLCCLNSYTLNREHTIAEIIKRTGEHDIIVSTTGKISREVYEQSKKFSGRHDRCFLTVGGMGHSSVIAFGIAANRQDKRVICFDGDGAALMHMGNLAFIAQEKPDNFIHICLNNNAHESVGGMPTAAQGVSLADIAESCGYKYTLRVSTQEELNSISDNFHKIIGPAFIEIYVANTSRKDLGRPKETTVENKNSFISRISE